MRASTYNSCRASLTVSRLPVPETGKARLARAILPKRVAQLSALWGTPVPRRYTISSRSTRGPSSLCLPCWPCSSVVHLCRWNGLHNSATATCCRCSAALIFFRPLGLVAAMVPVVASLQGCSGLSLLMFFSVILASGRGLVSARPGGVLCPLGFVNAVCVAAGGGSGGGNIF